MNAILEQITAFADHAHGSQQRKYAAERYIEHPKRVMNTCRRVTDDLCLLAAALLHDVLEDTPVTAPELEQYLCTQMDEPMAKRTLQLVVELTDVYVKNDYPNLNRRARKAKELQRLAQTSADSQTIKYADIIDNTREIATHDPEFAKVFLYECRAILNRLDKGNRELYAEAMKWVNDGIELAGKKGG